MRRRDEWFVRKVIASLACGRELDDDTLYDAARQAWKYGHYVNEDKKRRNAVARAKEALLNPDIAARFLELFAIAGFDVTDATAKHIEHIRNGSYPALRDYWAMTQPKPARQLDIRQAIVHVDTREPKAIAARALPAVVEQSEEQPRDA